MPRHVNYVPHGVIPAVLLPFDNDLAIDESQRAMVAVKIATLPKGANQHAQIYAHSLTLLKFRMSGADLCSMPPRP